MGEKQNPARPPDVADLTALVKEVIAYYKEVERTRFYAHPGADPNAFERLWPRILENFFLAGTASVAKQLRFLSQGHNN